MSTESDFKFDDLGPRGVAIKAPANFPMPEGMTILFEAGERVAGKEHWARMMLAQTDGYKLDHTPTIDHTAPEDPHDKRTVQERIVAKHYQQFNRKGRK